ncbi:MAG: hypothetical protein JNL74_02550 [Fibrobacteres bacterium]|nr:hypothetical protein [Fibrobacterota bacterium]
MNKKTGEEYPWGEYKPMDKAKVKEMQGRLGDLLHPKVGLALGVFNDPWYIETRQFLEKSVKYLEGFVKTEKYFAYKCRDNFILRKK